MSEAPRIFIHKFWTEYKTDPKDPSKLREVDWVGYSPIGSVQKTMNVEAISRLSAVLPMTGRGGDNPAVQMANARWNAIKPAYDAWKQGREVPVDGTPLAVWNGISPEQAEMFKMKGVRTIEDIAGLTDTHKNSMGIPGLHNIIDNAKRFLTAQDKNVVTTALAQKDAEIAELKAQMHELVEMVKEAKKPKSEPKRRGRPPKTEQPAEVAA